MEVQAITVRPATHTPCWIQWEKFRCSTVPYTLSGIDFFLFEFFLTSTPKSPRLSRQLARSHDIARIANVHRLSILSRIRLRLHVHHPQVVHPLGHLVARGRIAIAQHRSEDPIHTLLLIGLRRTAIVGRQVKAHVAYVGWIGRGPDPGGVPHRWVGELVTDGRDGLVGAGADVDVSIAVVGEALDTVRSGAFRLYDGDVAGVAGRIGGWLSEGSARVAHGSGDRRVVDCSVEVRGIGIIVWIVGDEADVGCW